MGPIGDATPAMLLADSEATLGETGGALDTAIEQIALWVGQQLHDTQSSLTAVKAKLTRWANKQLQSTGATINDVVAVLQANAAAYVDPQKSLPPNGASTTFPGVFPSAPVVSGAVQSSTSYTDVPPPASAMLCPPDTVTPTPALPTIPVPPGCEWTMIDMLPNGGGYVWHCVCGDMYGPPPTGGGSTGGGSVLSGLGGQTGNGQTLPPCQFRYADQTCFTGDANCLIPYAPYGLHENLYATQYPEAVPIYTHDGILVGFFSQRYVDDNCGSGGPPVPTVTAPTPCELPPDVASWPGQRVVILPFDLNQGGEASALGECGKLMLNDAIGKYAQVQRYLDILAAPDWLAALFPRAMNVGGPYPESE